MSTEKKKIALLGAFNLAEGYAGAAKALERLGHEIVFIPAMLYRHENPKNHVQLIIDHINRENSDICLWWRAETLTGIDFHRVRKAVSGKFILYSWDDPLQWERHSEMPYKCRFLDAAFSCCQDSVNMYKKHGVSISEWVAPGFDPTVHYPEEDADYKCDISIVATNLYDGNSITKHPHISRKVLLNNIIKEFPGIDLRIYGSENFKEIYPDHYKGWIHFDNSRKVFYNSRINISSHIRPDGDKYINERVSQILGSGGNLLVDRVAGIKNVLPPDVAIVFDNTEDCLIKIKSILDYNKSEFKELYHPYSGMAERGHKFALDNLTWDGWANKINENIRGFNIE